ncbi:hypothetical protein CLOM621_07836 [Clostridium sp. M62/1]|nr:hypothetical protein CLOM621_07836 [Clostridium sp. M62/1]
MITKIFIVYNPFPIRTPRHPAVRLFSFQAQTDSGLSSISYMKLLHVQLLISDFLIEPACRIMTSEPVQQ